MPARYYPPGTRKRNRWIVARGWVDGRPYEISTRTTNPKAAERAWDEFRAALRQGNADRPRAPRTFRQAVDAWKAARGIGEKSNEARYLRRLCDCWVDPPGGPFGDLPVAEVLPLHIGAAASALYPNAQAQTVNRQAFTPAATVLHFAAENGLRDYIVVRKRKEPRTASRRPDPGARGKLIAGSDGRERLFLTLLFFQGWRVTETLGLLAERIDMAARTVELYVRKSRAWKQIPLHPESFLALANLPGGLPPRGRVFAPWRDRHDVYDWLRPLCAGLGVTFTPHMARHEFAGLLRQAGAVDRDLVDVGSWTSERSVARYSAAPTDHARAVLTRLHPQPSAEQAEPAADDATGGKTGGKAASV